jgi:uncharacterized membrane protein HdeD (DUF308 family)
MTTARPSQTFGQEVARTFPRGWFLFFVTGILWLLLGFMLLSYRVSSISITVIFLAIVFGMGAVSLFVVSDVISGPLRTLAIVGAIAAVGGAIGALVWPGPTILVVALFVAWFLLLRGIVDVVISLYHVQAKGWWLTFLAGVISIALGAWAIGNPDRSVLLLVTILGVYAILHGVVDLIIGVKLHELQRDLQGS